MALSMTDKKLPLVGTRPGARGWIFSSGKGGRLCPHEDVGWKRFVICFQSINIQAVSESSACAAVRLDSAADFVSFWHATFGSPTVSTFVSAIDKGFIRVPGLTAAKVRRHPPNPVATAYGHLHATRQGIKSTKPKVPPLTNTKPAVSDDNIEEIFATRERRVWCQVDDVRVGRTHSDATGALPQRG